MMAIALRMAERGLGQTAPNPSVGAVIANEATGELIARSVTAKGGRPHAETQAIALAGDRTRGATIYVTLEPCSHHGHTGPCSDAIVAAGLKRAVVAIEDPDPRVAGRGLDRLRAAGIEVVRGVGAKDARWITRGHIVRVTERRPLVTLKLALNANGEIARGGGDAPVFVTGANARAHGHLLRARHDAILVGEGTVRDDDPLLTCRLPGLSQRLPVRVMLSRHLNERPDSRMAKTTLQAPDWLPERAPFWIFCSEDADPARRQLREDAFGVETIAVPTVVGKLWLPAVVEELVARGITRLLVEGGPGMWRSFAHASLVDEVVLYMAADPARGTANESRARKALQHQIGPVELSLAETRPLEPDTLWRFRRETMKTTRL
ncbi:MAG: bifunctional diaminohydroxyphosphoribosylaminopyrimidine deaminase/5-amino-6-(5-phosphoribosylamino)uracil reductase RibD [Hyphomicrobium sp.]|nr:bifunctional diaminohydroxyphosphoribosylaminopyrimidine deaminase/5-amino-6-(5-phosphoribosylamino)uracil reductase RibD [Hyphomicrobium sp.]